MLNIFSPVFKEGEFIPPLYTKDGQDVSPAIQWTGVPPKTSSLVLMMHDPDAPVPGGFTHWVVFNLPARSTGMPEGVAPREDMDNGAVQGKNSSGAAGYMGPAPPPGKPHRYHFTVYAIDNALALPAGAGRKDVIEATRGHILEQADLMGLYQR